MKSPALFSTSRRQKLRDFEFRDFEERNFIEFGINRFEQLG